MYDVMRLYKGVSFEALVCIIYIRERHYFSLVCTSRKVIDFFEVNVDVQKGPLGST